MLYVKKYSPVWLIIENSDMLLEDDVADCTEIMHTLSAMGYYCWPSVFESSEYGVPMSRRRSYIVGLARARSEIHSANTYSELKVAKHI